MNGKKIRIGFVGVGNMGQCAHLKNYAALGDQCEVVALAEVREQLGRKVAQRYGIPQVYASAEQMLEAESLDGIVASQPFTRHGVLIPELLQAGIPVFTEKPLAGTVAAGERIVRAVSESGTFVMVGYHKRSDPATIAAKAEIERLQETQELGRMTYIRITMPAGDWIAGGFNDLICSDEPCPPLDSDPADGSLSKEDYGKYLAFVNYYIHQINLMRHLLGEDYDVTYVSPSSVVLTGESESGVACAIEMSPYQTSIDWQESVLVCFERGWVKLELPAPLVLNQPGQVTFFRDPGEGRQPEYVKPRMPHVHAMRQQASNFIGAIKDEMKPMCTAAEALKDLQTARQYLQQLNSHGC